MDDAFQEMMEEKSSSSSLRTCDGHGDLPGSRSGDDGRVVGLTMPRYMTRLSRSAGLG